MSGLEHIAIIMDGNGRWAKLRKRPRNFGHRQGVLAVESLIDSCLKRSIPVLSLFAFSAENWKRPKSEVRRLMALFSYVLERYLDRLIEKDIQLRIIGDVDSLPKHLRQKIRFSESRTKHCRALALNIAVNYSGQWDIENAASLTYEHCRVHEQKFDVDYFKSQLALSDFPNIDLLIRTGGSYRISNFFLWQIAYTELFFTEILWPDFNDTHFQEAIDSFFSRQRNFGALPSE